MSREHLSLSELEAGLAHVLAAPKEAGLLELIVRRPRVDVREVLGEGSLSLDEGLAGDSWLARGNSKMLAGRADPNRQLTVMSSRAIALIAGQKERWPLAGDQLFVDLDLSEDNLPAGSRVAIGPTVIEVTSPPHTGCKKFVQRFGADAMAFVNGPTGRRLRLRGLNARVVEPGTVRVGDRVRKLEPA